MSLTLHFIKTMHGVIYGELKQTNQSKILSTTTSVDFSNNTALEGDTLYALTSVM